MFTGFTDDTVNFFMDFKFHNNAEFFHTNHKRYEETVQKPFYDMIETLAQDTEMSTNTKKIINDYFDTIEK